MAGTLRTDRGRAMPWPALLLNSRVKVKLGAAFEADRLGELEDGGVVLAELRIDGPGRGLVVVDGRLAPASPTCSKVARGLTSLTATAAPLPDEELRLTRKSLRAKLPLLARPGPPLTSDGWASASSRTAVRPFCVVRAVKV